HIGKRSKVNMPGISAQGKTSDPFRTVNCSIRPFVGNLRIEERVSSQEEPNASSWRRQSLRIVKKTGGEEEFGAGRRKVGQCRRIKRFAVRATQGEGANPLWVKRLPAKRKFRLLRVKLGVFLRENRRSSSRRCILAIPFFALGDVELETVCSWKIPTGAGHRNTHFLKGSPNVSVYL